MPVKWLEACAEQIPLADGMADTLVTTWTLCTIPDPHRALREMRRVLKPEGPLLFIEHGLSPDPHVRVWQDRLTPLWRRVGGGCHLNRSIDALFLQGGFAIERVETGYGAGPRPFVYLYRGVACHGADDPVPVATEPGRNARRFAADEDHGRGGTGMIARVWHGWTTREHADAYAELLRTRILPGIHRVKGYRGAYLLRRDAGPEVEFVTLTFFDSLDAVRAFAGEDSEAAVVSPEARKLLARFDARSRHYETIVEPA